MFRRLGVVLLAGTALACGGRSPSASVDLLMEAIADRDSAAVAQYMDVASVAESMVDPVITMAQTLSANNPEQFQVGGMGVEMLDQFRPMMAPFIEQLLWQMLINPENLSQGPLGAMLGEHQPVRLDDVAADYEGAAYERETGEDRAIVGVALGHAEDAPVVDFVLARRDGYWQVVGFENLAERLGALMERGPIAN